MINAKFTVETNEDELYCSHVIDEEFSPNRDLWKSWEVINTENETTVVDIKINHQGAYYCRLSIDSSEVELTTVTKSEAATEALYKAFVNLGVEFDSPVDAGLFTNDIADPAITAICNGLDIHNIVTSIVENF